MPPRQHANDWPIFRCSIATPMPRRWAQCSDARPACEKVAASHANPWRRTDGRTGVLRRIMEVDCEKSAAIDMRVSLTSANPLPRFKVSDGMGVGGSEYLLASEFHPLDRLGRPVHAQRSECQHQHLKIAKSGAASPAPSNQCRAHRGSSALVSNRSTPCSTIFVSRARSNVCFPLTFSRVADGPKTSNLHATPAWRRSDWHEKQSRCFGHRRSSHVCLHGHRARGSIVGRKGVWVDRYCAAKLAWCLEGLRARSRRGGTDLGEPRQ